MFNLNIAITLVLFLNVNIQHKRNSFYRKINFWARRLWFSQLIQQAAVRGITAHLLYDSHVWPARYTELCIHERPNTPIITTGQWLRYSLLRRCKTIGEQWQSLIIHQRHNAQPSTSAKWLAFLAGIRDNGIKTQGDGDFRPVFPTSFINQPQRKNPHEKTAAQHLLQGPCSGLWLNTNHKIISPTMVTMQRGHTQPVIKRYKWLSAGYYWYLILRIKLFSFHKLNMSLYFPFFLIEGKKKTEKKKKKSTAKPFSSQSTREPLYDCRAGSLSSSQ